MDDGHLVTPSVLKSLKKNTNFKLKQLLGDGKFTQGILLDLFPNQEAIGKIVRNRNKGEFTLWPHLRHDSLIPLLEIVTLDAEMWLLVCPYVKICLGTLIEEVSFLQHPKCFERKKSYIRDVLTGLEYLHQLSLSLMNLDDQNILICSRSDKALISDFSCCVSMRTATRLELSVNKLKFLPSELRLLEDSDAFECVPIDMWLYGVMVLQIFTRHVLPRIEESEDILSGLTIELLSRANSGSYLVEDAATCLNKFLEPFLRQDPRKRIGAKEATELPFLRCSARRLDEQARDFWKMKDALELISNANKINVQLRKCGQKSTVHTIRDENNFEYVARLKALKTMCSENICCRKAKSELYAGKSVQHVEGKIQPHKSIASINCLFENSNDAVPANSVEPHLFHNSIRSPCTAFYSSFDMFPCLFREEFAPDISTEFNSRQEKDPWLENEESHTKISKSWAKFGTSSQNSTTHSVHENNCLATISNSPSNFYSDNHQNASQETSQSSPIKLQLVSNQDSELFHQAILVDKDHLKTFKDSCEPYASNAMADITRQGRFSNGSCWRHEKDCVEKTSTVSGFSRRNAFRFKKGISLRNQDVAKTVPTPNPRDFFVHDELDTTAFSFFIDGMYSYNLRCPAQGKCRKKSERVEKFIKRDNFPLKVPSNSKDYEVDVSLEQPLHLNIENRKNIKVFQSVLFKNKPSNRLLRMLCPGSKTEANKAFTLGG